MGSTHLRLLDGFVLLSGDSPVELAGGLQRLLAFLAVRGPAHRCLVAGTLWPEAPEHQALASLRTAVWRSNRLVPEVVSAHGMSLAMNRTTTVDSREQESFATRVLRGHVEDEEGISNGVSTLLHGELLPGWYDEWVAPERERLSQLRLHALERAASILIRHRRLDVALQVALEAVRAEPLRETANATLMSVYLAEGNVWDAVHHYDSFRAMLQRELGLDPSPAVGRLLPGHGLGGAVPRPAR